MNLPDTPQNNLEGIITQVFVHPVTRVPLMYRVQFDRNRYPQLNVGDADEVIEPEFLRYIGPPIGPYAPNLETWGIGTRLHIKFYFESVSAWIGIYFCQVSIKLINRFMYFS